jgi:hypothetical protein
MPVLQLHHCWVIGLVSFFVVVVLASGVCRYRFNLTFHWNFVEISAEIKKPCDPL